MQQRLHIFTDIAFASEQHHFASLNDEVSETLQESCIHPSAEVLRTNFFNCERSDQLGATLSPVRVQNVQNRMKAKKLQNNSDDVQDL